MTRLMEQAIERLRALPESQQDKLAEFLLHELAADERWARSTADHADRLRTLIDQVLDDDARGQCPVIDPDKL